MLRGLTSIVRVSTKRPWDIVARAVCAGMLLCALCSGAINRFDEPYVVYPAFRVSVGELPYRDFFVLTTPLLYELLGACMRLFGPELWVGRLWAVAMFAAQWGALQALAARSGGLRAHPWLCGLPVFWAAAILGIAWYTHTALACALWALYFALSPGARASIACAVLASACFACKQDLGVFCVAGCAWLLRARGPGAGRASAVFAATCAASAALLWAWASTRGYAAQMLSVLALGIPLKLASLHSFVLRIGGSLAYFGAIAWWARRRPALQPYAAPVALVVFIACCAWLNDRPAPGKLVYGAAWGGIVGLWSMSCWALLLARASCATVEARLSWVAHGLFAAGLLAGSDLLHVSAMAPVAGLAWLARGAPGEDGALPRAGWTFTSLALAVCHVTSIHLGYAGTPPRWQERCFISGVAAARADCTDLTQLRAAVADFTRRRGRAPALLADPSPFYNFLLRLPSPLHRFTFYAETAPDALPAADLWLIHMREGADRPEPPGPGYRLRDTFSGSVLYESEPR